VRKIAISPMAMNTGIVASITAAMPDGTQRPEEQSVIENKDQNCEEASSAPLGRSGHGSASGAHPCEQNRACHCEAHGREKKWRNFAHANPDREIR
jgi:hypothetical protein